MEYISVNFGINPVIKANFAVDNGGTVVFSPAESESGIIWKKQLQTNFKIK